MNNISWLLLGCLFWLDIHEGVAQVSTGPETTHLSGIDLTLLASPSNDFVIADSVCLGDTVLAIYTGSGGSGASFVWDFGTGVVTSGSGGGPYEVFWSTAGMYQVCLTVTEGGVTSPTNCQTIVVKPRPQVTIDSVADQCFPGNSFLFTTSGDTADTYLWNFGSAAVPATFFGFSPPSVSYQSPGIKTVSLQVVADGCVADSIATASFQVWDPPSTSFIVSQSNICQGDSLSVTYIGLTPGNTPSYVWEFGSAASSPTSTLLQPPAITYDTVGVQTITLTVTDGPCVVIDSQVIEVFPTVETTDSLWICQGDSLLFGTQMIASAGVYAETFMSGSGCDSTVTLTVTVNLPVTTPFSTSICMGDSLRFGDQALMMPGTYRDTLMASNGCDSISILTLAVIPSADTVISDTVCEGDLPYIFGGQELMMSGSFGDTTKAATGCDSLIQLNLTVNEVETGISMTDSTLVTSATAEQYQWLDCNTDFSPIVGAATQTFSPPSNGNYAVITTEEGCTDTSACIEFTLVHLLAPPHSQWALAPNPTTGNITLDLGQRYPLVYVRLVNSVGQEVASLLHQDTSAISMHLPEPAGVYLLTVQTATGEMRHWRVMRQ